MAISGLRDYGIALGEEIATRWLKTVSSLYKRESKLVEKYAITRAEDGLGGHGGEYPLQDGFGWTNGVTRRLLHEDPRHEANEAKAGSRA
jgi:alpha,alpha-trehalase